MTLQQLRRRIDQVDRRLLRLLNQRAVLALRVGRLKKRHGRSLFDPRRERAILRRLAHANDGPLDHHSIRLIFREILRQSRRLEASAATHPSTVHGRPSAVKQSIVHSSQTC